MKRIQRKKSITGLRKEDISIPTNFVHLKHVGRDNFRKSTPSIASTPLQNVRENNFSQPNSPLPEDENEDSLYHPLMPSSSKPPSSNDYQTSPKSSKRNFSGSLINLSFLRNVSKPLPPPPDSPDRDVNLRRRSSFTFTGTITSNEPSIPRRHRNSAQFVILTDVGSDKVSSRKPLPPPPFEEEIQISTKVIPPLPKRWEKPNLSRPLPFTPRTPLSHSTSFPFPPPDPWADESGISEPYMVPLNDLNRVSSGTDASYEQIWSNQQPIYGMKLIN